MLDKDLDAIMSSPLYQNGCSLWDRGGAVCVQRSKKSSPQGQHRYGGMVFTVPLYLKAKSQGFLKEYGIHQDFCLQQQR